METKNKTRDELLGELEEVRRQLSQLEPAAAKGAGDTDPDIRKLDLPPAKYQDPSPQMADSAATPTAGHGKFSLNDLVINMDRQLHRIIHQDVALEIVLSPDLGMVKADPDGIQFVLADLIDASLGSISDGGKLTIETANVAVDEIEAQQPRDLSPGRYVKLTVRCTGVGPTEAVRTQLADPDATVAHFGVAETRLSNCHEIVRQNHGFIEMPDGPKSGNAVNVYLPRYEKSLSVSRFPFITRPVNTGYLPGGNETVLLVEDEPLVQRMVSQVLGDLGYQVLEAAAGVEALSVAEEHQNDKIDLLLTELALPQIGGKELAQRFSEKYCDVKVLFMSPFFEGSVAAPDNSGSDFPAIQKPFLPETLALKVRQVLDKS